MSNLSENMSEDSLSIVGSLEFLLSNIVRIILSFLLISSIGTLILFYFYSIETSSKFLVLPLKVNFEEFDERKAGSMEINVNAFLNANSIKNAISRSNINLETSELQANLKIVNESLLIDPLLKDLNLNSTNYIKENLANSNKINFLSESLQKEKKNHYKLFLNSKKFDLSDNDEMIFLTNLLEEMNNESYKLYDFTYTSLKTLSEIDREKIPENLLLQESFYKFTQVSNVVENINSNYQDYAPSMNQLDFSSEIFALRSIINNLVALDNDTYNRVISNEEYVKGKLSSNILYLDELINQIDGNKTQSSLNNLNPEENSLTVDSDAISRLLDIGEDKVLNNLKIDYLNIKLDIIKELSNRIAIINQLKESKEQALSSVISTDQLLTKLNKIIREINEYVLIVRDSKVKSVGIQQMSPMYYEKEEFATSKIIIFLILNFLISFSIIILYYALKYSLLKKEN